MGCRYNLDQLSCRMSWRPLTSYDEQVAGVLSDARTTLSADPVSCTWEYRWERLFYGFESSERTLQKNHIVLLTLECMKLFGSLLSPPRITLSSFLDFAETVSRYHTNRVWQHFSMMDREGQKTISAKQISKTVKILKTYQTFYEYIYIYIYENLRQNIWKHLKLETNMIIPRLR